MPMNITMSSMLICYVTNSLKTIPARGSERRTLSSITNTAKCPKTFKSVFFLSCPGSIFSHSISRLYLQLSGWLSPSHPNSHRHQIPPGIPTSPD